MAVVAAGAVTAAILVSLPHHESARHKALAAYIEAVDGVQGRMIVPLSRVTSAYQSIGSAKTMTPRTRAQLVQAEKTLRTLRRRLAALDAPRDAVRLRADMLRLVAGEVEITHEVNLLARFSPAYRSALAQLQRASKSLGVALAAIDVPTQHAVRGTRKQIAEAQAAFAAASDRAAGAQADAVDAYDGVVSATLARLGRLSPPPSLAPAFRSERQSLASTRRAGQRLAGALRSTNRSDVPKLARAFTVATRSSQTAAAQRAEIAAVKAYDARVRGLEARATAVQQEVARLQQTVH